MQEKIISGFSKLSKAEKLAWVTQKYITDPAAAAMEIAGFTHADEDLQRILDGFSENTVANFPMPFSIAPNFLINGHIYAVPMVIEESSVVAAASSAAKFWLSRGGFKAEVRSTVKLGQVHFTWPGEPGMLERVFPELERRLREESAALTENMEKRGGGVGKIELVDLSDREPNLFQLRVSFETCDSMGANFINSVLERFSVTLQDFAAEHPGLQPQGQELTVIMSILSNFTPDCLVRAYVECPVERLSGACADLSPAAFADKFHKAVRIARVDPYRAVTHNKGIFNGIDAVVLATANDFRAIEACGHAYAARDGQYRSLSDCVIEDGLFRFWLDLPLAVGTVGGLTKLHPLARRALDILGNPSAAELMAIIACTGLAQNFAALRSLITTGIQSGHMKMHLANILNHLGAGDGEIQAALRYFQDKTVSYAAVRAFLGMKVQEPGMGG